MAKWNEAAVNSLTGANLLRQTTYEQHYLRSAIRMIRSRLPNTVRAAEFGAGYGRLTPILQEFFHEAIGFEREAELVTKADKVPSLARLERVETLAHVPLAPGDLAFAFTCTVLQHMLDEEVAETLTEMRRVTADGFILLVESSRGNALHGTYKPGAFFAKGRDIETYQSLMSPWQLDYTRPRHIGDKTGGVWGHLMMFRDAHVRSEHVRASGEWSDDELKEKFQGRDI